MHLPIYLEQLLERPHIPVHKLTDLLLDFSVGEMLCCLS